VSAATREKGYWDFRFSVGAEPAASHAKYEPAGAPSFEGDWDAAGGSLEFNVSHRFAARGPHSGFLAFGPFARGFSGNNKPDTGTELSLGAGGLQVGGGYSFRPNEIYALEIGPRIGFGFSSADETAPGSGKVKSDTGAYFELGLGATNLFTFGKFQVGVSVGIASWAAAMNYPSQIVATPTGPATFPGADATYSGHGGYAGISMGFR
jgi:hypothetical protein